MSVVRRELQVKTTVRYHYIPIKAVKMPARMRYGSSLTWLVGTGNGAAALQNHLAVLQKVKHRLTLEPSHSFLRSIAKRNKSLCPHKTLHTNVHSSTTQNRQEVVMAHVSS